MVIAGVAIPRSEISSYELTKPSPTEQLTHKLTSVFTFSDEPAPGLLAIYMKSGKTHSFRVSENVWNDEKCFHDLEQSIAKWFDAAG